MFLKKTRGSALERRFNQRRATRTSDPLDLSSLGYEVGLLGTLYRFKGVGAACAFRHAGWLELHCLRVGTSELW